MSVRSELLQKYNMTRGEPVTSGTGKSAGGSVRRRLLDKAYGDVNEGYINSFLSDARAFLDNAEREYGGMNYGNAASSYETKNSSYLTLKTKSAKIRGWLDLNKTGLEEETYNSLTKMLDDYDTASSGLIGRFKEASDYYSQWKTEDEYKAAAEKAQAYEKRWSEIIGDYDPEKHQQEGKSGWDDYLATQERIAQNKAQEEEEKPWWEKMLGYLGEVGQDTSMPIHTTETVSQGYRDWEANMQKPDERWTEEQKNTFGYLWKNNRANAGAYAYTINSRLNTQQEQEAMQDIKAWATDNVGAGTAHTVGAILTAPLGIADYLGDVIAQGALGYIPDSDGQVTPFEYSQEVTSGISQKLNEAGGVLNENIPIIGGKGWGDVYGLGTSILQSTAAAYSGGSAQALITFFGSAAASGVDDAMSRGASGEQALLYGTAVGAAEALAEMIGIDNLMKIGSSETVKQLLVNLLKQSGAEGLEEGITNFLGNVADNAIMREKSNFYLRVRAYMGAGLSEEEAKNKAWAELWEEMAYDVLGGFVSGGVHAGPQTAFQTYQTNKQNKATGNTIMSVDGGVDVLKALANEVAGVSDANMQNTITRQVGEVSSETATGKGLGKFVAGVKNSSNATKVGRLYNTVQTANNLANASANQADIAKSLERKGFNTETASDIASALVAEYNGQELTKAQKKLLKSARESKIVQDAISSIVTNEQSTMGQRSQNIRSFQSDISRGVAIKAITETIRNNTTAKQFTPTGEYEVADQGKAINTETGEDIDIKGVSAISKGKLVLELADGTTIDAKSVSFASDGDALIYEAVANLGDNINAETANKLISKYDGGNAMVFARGIAQAYSYGFYGLDRSEMKGKNTLSSDLTEEQRNYAYGLGEQYRSVKDQVDKAKARAMKAPAEKGVYYRDKDGNVTDIRTYLKQDRRVLNEMQTTGIEFMEKMSQMMGVRFNVFEGWEENGTRYYLDENGVKTEGSPNGFYDPKTGEIYIDLFAGNDFQGTMLFTVAHELTHFMRRESPEHFTKIAKIVFQHGGMKGNVSELIALKQAKAKAKGKPISYDTAMEEVVADGMETILKDGKVVEFMADVKKTDSKVWAKLKEWFKNFAEFLKKMVDAYSGESAQTVEGQKVADFSKKLLNQIEQIWAEGAVSAGENYQAAKVQENTTEEGGVMYSLKYDDAIEQLHAGTLDRTMNTHLKVLNNTPQVYIDKAGAKDLKIIMGWDIAYLAMNKSGDLLGNYHGLGPEVMKAIPQALQDPLYIVKQDNGRIIAVTEVVVKGNRSTLVSIELDAFKSTTQDGESESENYNLIVTIFDAKTNYLQKLMNNGEIVHNKNNEDPAHFILRLKSLNKALPDDDRAKSSNKDIAQDKVEVKSESAEAMDVEVDEKTESVAPTVLKSERTWNESDYVQERDKAAKEIANAIGVSEKKAKAYIDSVNSIAKMIADDRVRLDYFSSPGKSSFVSNVEYGGSFDFSTLCKKRRLLTGTFTAIQNALPNTALTADEILDIRNRMKENGLEVSCGLCYVEGSRANMGQFAKEFLKLYKQYYPDAWQPNMADVNTPDGIEWVRINHPECYEQYEYFWNHYGTLKPGDKNLFASQQKPKLYQLHTEYKGEILEKFNDDDNVEEKNLNGGIRLQSFSDFEIVHLIDTMQIIVDMSRVGLAGQAYTKVPDFAWALGDTGLKINLSLIAKDVDENGKLIFDDVEGMPIETAVELRNRYSKNVGTILGTFNDEQLMAAMADERVDFIIPFHRSQWKKRQYEAMGLPAKTKDYTYMQNERFIKPQYHEYRGKMVKDKATNYMPNEYWDFSKSGKENAQSYLEMCARNNKRPKFYKLLQNNGDGSYSLKADGSTDGYWKLLIDFKMYDNEGNGSPQMPVRPEFNMDEATRMLNDYSGGHSNFPVAQGIVDSFVEEYKASHEGVLYSDRDYSYEALTSKPDMKVTTVGGNAPKNRADVAHLAKQNAAKVGKFNPKDGSVSVYVDDIDTDVILSTKGLRHGLRRTQDPLIEPNYIVTVKAGEILKNAIRINEITPSDNNADGSYVLIGAAQDADGMYVVRFVVNHFDNNVVSMDVLYAVNAKKELAAHNAPRLAAKPLSVTSSVISIAELLDHVNKYFPDILPEGVLRHFGYDARPEGDLGQDALYQDRAEESVSNRSLLANAFEGLAQNDMEKNKIQEYKGKVDLINSEQRKLQELNAQIKEMSFAKGPRDTKKISTLRDEATKTANRISIYDKQLLRLEASAPLQKVLEREKKKAYQRAEKKGQGALAAYRKKAEQEQKELTEKWRESRKKASENRQKTELRKKIRKVIRDLDKILNRGDKKRNVKEGMKDFVAEALASAEVLFTDNYTNEDIIHNGFGVELSEEEAKYLDESRAVLEDLSNLPAGGYDAWQARQEAEEQLKSKLAYRMSKLKDAFFRERQRLNKTEVADVLGKLADAYAKLETSEYDYVNGAYHEAVYEYLKMLQEDVGGAKVKDMTIGQLEELYKAYTMVLTTVKNANKMFAGDLKQGKEELANRIMMEVYKAGGEHGLWSKGQLARNQASWNNTKPIYAAERIGSSTFVKLVNGLFKGQYGWATDIEEAKAFRRKVAEKYGFKSWDMEKTYKFTSSSGIEFELNLNQIMSLYAYSKRDKAHDHLLKGGFVFGKNTEVVVTKNGIKRTYLNKSAKAHTISDEIMGEIVGKLSTEQKGFVDEMQDYLSDTMGSKGNEVSMRIYGVKLFGEKFYFPLRSAGQYKEKAKEADLQKQQGQVSIVNSGFTHATKPKASNSVVLDGFTDVWASHVNDMSLYHSMVLPMEDYRRVYNYSSPTMEGQEPVSVNSFIENAYGDAATGYFDQLYKELNGGAIVDPRENLSKQMIGKFKKSAVMLSNSVVVQQFSAIGRASALINPKYFIGSKVDNKKHTALWNEMKKYAPVAIIKEMGGFDTHTGLSAKDYLLAEEYGKGERIKGFAKDKQYRDEIMGRLPAKADELTWCAIWEAVKRETKAKNPKTDVKSDEFLKKAGERFCEVIEKTQVYDSVLARSANMRSKNGLMQMLTAFMAEPTTTVNMIEDALRKGGKKVIARTLGAVAASVILNNALASIVYAMRDDDEDETFLEKYAQAFISGMLDDINPMTYYPGLKDIWSLFQGYDIERSDMAIYSDIADAVKKVVNVISQYDSGMDDEDAAKYYKKVTDAVMSLLDAGASAFGIPLKNVRRDLLSYRNTFDTLYGDWFGDRNTTWNSFWDAVGGAALDSIPIVGMVTGKSTTDKLYDAIVSGDTDYVNRLKGGYKDQSAINNAIRKGLRENDLRIRQAAIAWNANDLDEYMRLAKEIIAEKHFVQDDVVVAIRSEANSLAPDDGTTSTSKAKGLFTAEKFAAAVADGDYAVASAAKKDIILTEQKNGKSEEEAEKAFVSSAKTELKELFLTGDISEQKAVDALKAYCGSTQNDAVADVRYWAFVQDYPDVYADDQWFDTYYEKIADSGIGIEVYVNYRNKVSTITGEGKKERRMAVINSLPITRAQKDALYFAEGWTESTLDEAPWH